MALELVCGADFSCHALCIGGCDSPSHLALPNVNLVVGALIAMHIGILGSDILLSLIKIHKQ